MSKRSIISSYILGIVVIMVLSVIVLGCGSQTVTTLPEDSKAESEPTKMTESQTQQDITQPRTTEAETEKPTEKETEAEADPIVGNKTSFTDLGVGGIAKVKNYYIGLQYVKRMSYLPTALNTRAEVTPGTEAIIGFFEFFNASWGEIEVNPTDDIICYADGIQVGDVKNTFNVEVDGVDQFFKRTTFDALCRIVTCQDFEVPTGWNELKFFYGDNCIWTVTNEDVSTEDYTPQVMIWSTESPELTKEDEVIFSEGYQVQYKGHRFYQDKWGERDFIVFKFCITNNSSQTLNTGHMGYNMRAYQDGTRLEDPHSTMDDSIDGYLNVFDVDSIAPNMSSNVYVAFVAKKRDSDWQMVFDDGWLTSHYCGTIYVSDQGESKDDPSEETKKGDMDGKHVGTYYLYQIRDEDGTTYASDLAESLGVENFALLELQSDGVAIITVETLEGPYEYQYTIDGDQITLSSELETFSGSIHLGANGIITLNLDEETVWEFWKMD